MATAESLPSAELGWNRMAPILTVQFIGTLGYSIATPFLVFVVSDLGGAPWTYGLVGATYSACQLVGAPVLGRWSDRSGRRPVLLLSQAGTFLAWVLFLVALLLPRAELASVSGATLTIPLLLVFGSRALDGLTGGNISVASAYVADITRGLKEQRQIAFGRMGIATSLGFAVGPALAGLLGGTRYGYGLPVVVAAAISAAATLLCLRIVEPRSRCPQGPPPQPAVARVLGQQQRRCDKVEAAKPEVLRSPTVVLLLAATFVLFLAFSLFYASFPLYADAVLNWDPGELGLFFAVLASMMMIAQGPLLRLALRHLSPEWVFALGIACLAAAFAAYNTTSSTLMFVGAGLFALGNGLSWPTFQARLADVVPDEDQGAVQGAATSAGSLASILGLVVGALLYPSLQGGVFLLGAGLLALLAAGTPIWFARRLKIDQA